MTISCSASPAAGSIAGNQREWSIGSAFTKPPPSLGPSIVKRASIRRRSFAASVAPNMPPGSRRGPARPTVTGRVIQIDPSFFG